MRSLLLLLTLGYVFEYSRADDDLLHNYPEIKRWRISQTEMQIMRKQCGLYNNIEVNQGTDPDFFSSHVVIRINGTGTCAGTLISRLHVLTAASCFVDRRLHILSTRVEVFLLRDGRYADARRASFISYPHEYRKERADGTARFDIAVVELRDYVNASYPCVGDYVPLAQPSLLTVPTLPMTSDPTSSGTVVAAADITVDYRSKIHESLIPVNDMPPNCPGTIGAGMYFKASNEMADVEERVYIVGVANHGPFCDGRESIAHILSDYTMKNTHARVEYFRRFICKSTGVCYTGSILDADVQSFGVTETWVNFPPDSSVAASFLTLFAALVAVWI